ncbi:MAG: hypothetical protein ACFE98_15125 [Candidatus Hermodarchaeota archaeon]
MNTNEFLQKFEEKLNFQSFSTKTKMVKVDFFLSHILPQVEVTAIIPPFQARGHELSDLLAIYTLPKTFDETWLKEGGSLATRPPCGVLFYGIGFPPKDRHGPLSEYSVNVLYYRSIWVTHPKKEEKSSQSIPEEEVIQIIRDAQEEEDQRVRCQKMSMAEIMTSMSREFIDGWFWTLGAYMERILPQTTDDEDLVWPLSYFSGGYDPATVSRYSDFFYSDFKWFFPPPNLGPDFRSGGRNANRIQIQHLKQIKQGGLALIDVLRMLIQDVKTIVQNRDETAKGRIFFPEALSANILEEKPQLITLVFDDMDRPTPTEYLQQFERCLDIHPLITGKERKVSTDTLINYILPQVVILTRPIDLDKSLRIMTEIRIVTVDKTGYKDLLEGKLRDTIVFHAVIFDEQTGQRGELDSFRYYLSPLSDHIWNMRSHDLGFRIVSELEEVSFVIRHLQDESHNY